MKNYTDKELVAMDNGAFNKAFFKRFKKFLAHAKDLRCSLMGFGVEPNRGWNSIIWRLTEAIEKEKPHKEFEITQIKEKFGGLRYYITSGSEKIFKLIDKAERVSYKTCEECGEPGSLDTRFGWYLTLCRKCKKARAEKKKAEQEARFEELVAERRKAR